MSGFYETGHVKNVANFQLLITYCQNLAEKYNPGKPSLALAALEAKLQQANDEMQNVIAAKRTFDNATNLRRNTFADLKPFVTKVINAYAVSGATALAIADANGIKRKIHGVRAVKKQEVQPAADTAATTAQPNTAAAPAPKYISASQLSYDNQIDQMKKLVELLTADKYYLPNEKELQTVSLTAKLDDMKASTAEQMKSGTKFNDALTQRDAVLYDPASGLVPIALEVKKYVKSIFGAKSPQFKQVNGISFRSYLK